MTPPKGSYRISFVTLQDSSATTRGEPNRIVIQIGYCSILVLHGGGHTLIAIVSEVIADFPVMKSGQSQEVEPLVCLDHLSVQVLYFTLTVLAVGVLQKSSFSTSALSSR